MSPKKRDLPMTCDNCRWKIELRTVGPHPCGSCTRHPEGRKYTSDNWAPRGPQKMRFPWSHGRPIDPVAYEEAMQAVMKNNAGAGYVRACKQCGDLHPIEQLTCPRTGHNVGVEPLKLEQTPETCVVEKQHHLRTEGPGDDILQHGVRQYRLDLETERLITGRNIHSVMHICPTHGTGCNMPGQNDCVDCKLYLSGADVRKLINEAIEKCAKVVDGCVNQLPNERWDDFLERQKNREVEAKAIRGLKVDE